MVTALLVNWIIVCRASAIKAHALKSIINKRLLVTDIQLIKRRNGFLHCHKIRAEIKYFSKKKPFKGIR